MAITFKKSLRLSGFDYSSNNYYFITQNVDFKNKILIDGIRKLVENELYELEKRFLGLKIDKLAIVYTHIHVIFILNNCKFTISQIMQAYKSITTIKAKKFGLKLPRLWQPTYYERIIRNEDEYFATRNYIVKQA